MAPIKIGIVGLSAEGAWASRSHLPYLQRTDQYKIVALQNSSQESAQKAAAKYSLSDAATYGDIDSLVKDANVDLVAVSVKVPHHYELVKPALEAQKDVFVEWPLAANLKQAEELVALARSQKVKTLVGLQARQNPSVRKARELVNNGELGQILSTTLVGYGGLFGPQVPSIFEYGLPIEHGANLLTIPAGHAIDALCYVVGEFRDLQATLVNIRPEVPVVDVKSGSVRTLKKTSHDHVSVQGNLERGGLATVVYKPGTSDTGRDFYWEIVGTKGTLVLEGPNGHVQMFHPTLKFAKAGTGELKEIPVEVASDFSVNVGNAWDAFAGKGEGSVTTFEDALIRHKLIDAIYRSNEKGTRESYL
ncbi:hypothetical protein DV735_g4390, partial [Chaetothyriales sp. CBS 134920]